MTINIDTNCFNEILFFNTKNYRAGHFAINKKGDMVVEYSDEHSRLFYGLKNNGRYFFETENNLKEINDLQNYNQTEAYPRYESNNIFVYLENDINKEKGYLFSASSYITATELHDLENDNYTVMTTKYFMGYEIYGFVFPFLEARYNNSNIYFCIFNDNYYYGMRFTIRRFGFKSFDLDSNDLGKIKTETYSHTVRIISAFIMEEDDILAVFYMNSSYWYNLNLYDFDLNLLEEKISLNMRVVDPFVYGIFFKGIYLKEKYVALIYFLEHNNGMSLYLEILNMNIMEGNYNFSSIIKHNLNLYNFTDYITMNEFLKINPDRLVYISTINYKDLYILFFDLYNNYTVIKTRVYFLNFPLFELQLELSACVFNNFLVFTGTFYYTNDAKIFSLFLIFGFPKGIDNKIDISPYILDSESYNPNINLVNSLIENFIIENNLFNYEKINKIKLVSIPGEIIFYNNNNFFPLSNGSILDVNYRLIYNNEIIKQNKYYELHYQYIVKEQNYSEFYKYEEESLNYNATNETNFDTEFKQTIYYGRMNILKFKLCHDLCKTCLVYGTSNYNQKCLSCESKYDYNYFTKSPFNCLQEGYFQDNEIGYILRCNSTNSKNYFDKERNKTICFKVDYDCPKDYSNYNETTNECLPTLLFEGIIKDLIYSNYTNEEIFSIIIIKLIQNYNGKSNNIIEGNNNKYFQLTTSENEINTLKGKIDNKYNLSVIDLGDCENKLRERYNINESIPLIILKTEKLSSIISEKYLQYEVYNSETKEKLNLSICDTNINIFYPITLNENQKDLYEDMNKLGYDMFDINDKFYQDICASYETENGTDIILSDRINDIYNDSYSCPSNCKYSSYLNQTGYLVCECSIVNENITIEEIGNFVFKEFINVFHTLNYKFIKCYKLVFHKNVITKNLGSWFCIVLFFIYLVFLILYAIRGTKSLMKEVDVFIEKKKKRLNTILVNNNLSYNKMEESNKSLNIQESNKKLNNNNFKLNKNKGNEFLTINKIDENKKKENKNLNETLNNNDDNKENKNENDNYNNDILNNNHQIIRKIKVRKRISLFELENLKYEEAIKIDKRTFIQMYLSKIKRQHIIMFTFCSDNDFNLIYIKLARFSFEICTNIAMNALFFSDESMHKIYLNYGKYDFVQQIPQIIYSSLISQIFNLLISFLVLTESQMHVIIGLKEKEPEKNLKEIERIDKCIKIKFIIFFSITSLLFVIYWYFISAFCAVYENTQITFLTDFITSFFTEFFYPFVIYYVLAFFRKISLKDKDKKRLNILYIIGNL